MNALIFCVLLYTAFGQPPRVVNFDERADVDDDWLNFAQGLMNYSPGRTRLHRNCYSSCGNQGGACDWCGANGTGKCCRDGWEEAECGHYDGPRHYHGCVAHQNAQDKVIVGVESFYEDFDRRWKFTTSSEPGLRCNPLSFNDFTHRKQDWDFTCPHNQALAGINTEWNFDDGDRRWQFQCCDIRSPDNQGNRYYIESIHTTEFANDIGGDMNVRCNRNQVVVGLSSVFDKSTGYYDRRWKVKCGLVVPDYTRSDVPSFQQLTTFRKLTGEVNNLHKEFAFELFSNPNECPSVDLVLATPYDERWEKWDCPTFDCGCPLPCGSYDVPCHVHPPTESGVPVVIDIGPSSANTVLRNQVGAGSLVCPEIVDQSNRIGNDNFGDIWEVVVTDGRDIRVTRVDTTGGWGLYLQFRCFETNNHAVFTGMASVFDGSYTDRRFQMYTTSAPGMRCDPAGWTGFQNDFDNELKFTCPVGHAMAGFGGVYHGNYRDRRFRFRCCDVSSNGYSIAGTRSIGFSDFHQRNDAQCAHNEVLVGLHSYHADSPEDRRWSLQCGTLLRTPPAIPVPDDCTAIDVLEVVFPTEPTFGPDEEQLADLQTLAADLNFCGNPRVPTGVMITQSGQESVSKSDTVELARSLDSTFSFGAAVNAALNFGVEFTRAIERKIRSRSTSLGVDFLIGASADAGISFNIGSTRTTATTTSTQSVLASSLQATFEPKPFQWHVATGTRRTQDVRVPMRIRAVCRRRDGGNREEWLDIAMRTEGTTQIAVSFDDRTRTCPQRYYRNCECVPDLASNFVGAGCVEHPVFLGHPGCYVYRGNGLDESCTNGEALGTAPARAGVAVDDSMIDEGVDGIAFGWSYLPCGGDQYYPGDRNFVGVSFDDLVIKNPESQCQSGSGGTLSQEPFATRNAAIEECYIRNLQNPNSCLGVYDPQCDNVGQFFLCSPAVELRLSSGGRSPSCVYVLFDQDPDPSTSPFPTPENGNRRTVPSLPAPSLPSIGRRRQELPAPSIGESTFEELWAVFKYDLHDWWCEEHGCEEFDAKVASMDAEVLLRRLDA